MFSGDEDAFTMLYRRRQGPVFRFALQMTGNVVIAEDVTQEVFMALLSKTAKYDPARGTLASFLYGVARNLVLRRIEKTAEIEDYAGPDEYSRRSDPARDHREREARRAQPPARLSRSGSALRSTRYKL